MLAASGKPSICARPVRRQGEIVQARRSTMSVPRIVSADEWLAERKELLAAEEQAAKALASVSERRRELPAVRVEKEYLFDGPTGRVSLLEMFEGRRQLIVQH